MNYKVQVLTARGSVWLGHDCFLGLETLYKNGEDASLFKGKFSIEEAQKFLRRACSSMTPIYVINHEVKE